MVITLVPSTPANANSSDVNDYLARINALRASVGSPPLTLDANLSSLAQSWTQTMASAGAISHTPNLASGVTAPWTRLGENVGMGPNSGLIFNGFVNSPGHYENLVNPAFTHVGIGVVWSGNMQFTTHRFMAVGSVQTPNAQPTPPPAPAPAPAPVYVQPAPVTPPPTAPVGPEVTSAPATPSTESATPNPIPQAPVEPARVAAVLDALHSLTA